MYKRGLGVLIGIMLYCLFLYYMLDVVFPFVLAIIFYLMIKPLIDYLEYHFHFKRSVIGLFLLLCIYVMLAILFMVIGIFVILFLFDMISRLPVFFQNICIPFMETIYQFICIHFPFLMNKDIIYSIIGYFKQFLIWMMTSFSVLLSQIPQGLFTFFIFIISTFFLALDYESIRMKIIQICPHDLLEHIIHIKNQTLNSLNIYLKCQLLLMLLTFIVLSIAFQILKLQHPYIYAFWTALLDSLPIIGVGFVLFPIALIFCLQKAYVKGFYIILIYLFLNIIRSFLEPRIMNKQLQIPSFFLLLSMIIHLHFFGIIGLFLSPIHMNFLYSFLNQIEFS